MPDHRSYIREKLRGASATIRDDDRPLQNRLRSAYVQDLSNLESRFFPHPDAQDEFSAIEEAFNRYGEMIEGRGQHADFGPAVTEGESRMAFMFKLEREDGTPAANRP